MFHKHIRIFCCCSCFLFQCNLEQISKGIFIGTANCCLFFSFLDKQLEGKNWKKNLCIFSSQFGSHGMCENLYDVRYIPEAKTIKELQVSKVLNLKNCTGKPRVFSNVPGVHCLNKSCNIDEVGATLVCLSVYTHMPVCTYLSVCLYMPVYLSVCLYMPVCLFCFCTCLSVCMSVHTCLSVLACLSVHACLYLPVCPLSVCLSFCTWLSVFLSLGLSVRKSCSYYSCFCSYYSCFFRFPSLIPGLIGSNPNPINKINTK